MTETSKPQGLLNRYWWVIGIAIAVAIVVVFAPNASSSPDGLEKVAEDGEFAHAGEDARYEWLPDYSIPGIENEDLSTVLSGIIGVGIMVALVGGVAYVLTRVRRMREGDDGSRQVPGAG
ncbi:MAG: PDGLE domain-containing protein [Dehalococcoidia bacterium]|nr:PDGLE domain-containing protein [Dehalococcoidia bacterium]